MAKFALKYVNGIDTHRAEAAQKGLQLVLF